MHHRRLLTCMSGLLRPAADDRSGSAARPSPPTRLRLLVAAVASLGLVVVVPTTAEAQGDVITIDFDDVVFAPAGSLVPVGSVAVASDLQGRTCRTSVLTANQSSIHPENDLLIATGGSTARIEDVEDFTNGTNSWLVDVTLGSTIDMSVEMGPDEISSLGFTVEVDCSKPLVGTTVPVLASSVTTSTTTTSTTVGSETTPTTSATTTTAPTTTVESTTTETTETTGTTTTTSAAPSSTQLQVQQTTTTIATTVSSTTAPTVTIPTTSTTQPAETTSTTEAQGQLEQSPPASAVPAQPSYTG